MKILIINGSARKKGNTAQLLELVGESLQAEAKKAALPLEIESLSLSGYDLGQCLGCRVCFDRGESHCPRTRLDRYPELVEKMRAAEGLIIASPVYVDDVSGITKTWIDRTAWACHRPLFYGKSALALATVADSPCSHTLRTLTLALCTWGYHVAGQAGLKMGAFSTPEETRKKIGEEARKIARNFFHQLQSEQAMAPSFLSLMMFRIQQIGWGRSVLDETQQETPDAQYWLGNGWLEKGTSFYFPHRAGWLKTSAARLTGRVISWFVI